MDMALIKFIARDDIEASFVVGNYVVMNTGADVYRALFQ